MIDPDEDPAVASTRERSFRPGFRLSVVDGLVLLAGALLAWWVWPYQVELAVWGATAVLHFFLFCNVVRVGRALELWWSVWFVGCVSLSVASDLWWGLVAGLVAAATCLVVWREIGKPSYHGVLWRRLNPGLRQWWLRHGAETLG